MSAVTPFLTIIQNAYPELTIHSASLRIGEGQFSDVVFVNDALVFRFPRTSFIVAEMMREVPLLTKLQGRLPLPIPNPQYQHFSPDGSLIFMGYPLLPGEPLWRETFATLTDETVLKRLAEQLAGFLKVLHGIPAAEIVPDAAPEGTREEWQTLYEAIRAALYPFMRPDARDQVTAHFEAALHDPTLFEFDPVLRHGDFGTGNLLYDVETQSISGVIDFTFCALGDPAQDTGALASSYGEAFLRRCFSVYPALQTMQKRAAFIRGTYALQQALSAQRDDNSADFEDGMQDFV